MNKSAYVFGLAAMIILTAGIAVIGLLPHWVMPIEKGLIMVVAVICASFLVLT